MVSPQTVFTFVLFCFYVSIQLIAVWPFLLIPQEIDAPFELIPLPSFLLFSSHNWNSLFIGADAVAEAIAQKYQTTKSQVLDGVSIAHSHKVVVNYIIPS